MQGEFKLRHEFGCDPGASSIHCHGRQTNRHTSHTGTMAPPCAAPRLAARALRWELLLFRPAATLPSNRSAELLLGPWRRNRFTPSGSSALRSRRRGARRALVRGILSSLRGRRGTGRGGAFEDSTRLPPQLGPGESRRSGSAGFAAALFAFPAAVARAGAGWPPRYFVGSRWFR